MSPSNSLLDNRSFNKLAVNRLETQALRSNNIQSETISYLFSVLLENGTFERNNTGGNLTYDLNAENNDVIVFSDRPFRKTNKISMTSFVALFTLDGSNSFEEDPPNIVVAHSEEQRTYVMKLSSQNNNQVVFTLELLPHETHDLTTVTGIMNLFVDNSDNSDLEKTKFTFQPTNIDTPKITILGTYKDKYGISGHITSENFKDAFIVMNQQINRSNRWINDRQISKNNNLLTKFTWKIISGNNPQ